MSRVPVPSRRLSRAIAAAGLAIAGLLAAVPAAVAVPYTGSGCAQVEVIGARGTNQPAGFGSPLADQVVQIQNRLSQTVGAYPLPYPASFNYNASVSEGERALIARLNSESARCPSKTFVLLGFSQGANVVGDALDRSGTQLSAGVVSKVRAVVLLGDPRFRGGESFNRGTHNPARSGIFARPTGDLVRIAGVTAAYCDAGDNICQSGDSGNAHGGYARYRDAITSFVASKY